MQKIDEMIAKLDLEKLRAGVETNGIEPRPYQWLVYEKTAEIISQISMNASAMMAVVEEINTAVQAES